MDRTSWTASDGPIWMVHLHLGGLAQLGRASALQADGHRFDPDSLHHFIIEENAMHVG